MADCANKQSLQASLFSLSFCLFFLLPFHFDPIFFSPSLTGLSVLSFTLSPPVAIPLAISSPLSSSLHLPTGFTFLLVTLFFLSVFLSLSLRPSLSLWHSPTIHKSIFDVGSGSFIWTFCTVAMGMSNFGGEEGGRLWALCEKDCDRGSLAANTTSNFSCHPLCLLVRGLVVQYFFIFSSSS